MKKHSRNTAGRCIAAAVFLAFAVPALADDDRFTVHGFGNQDYSKSSANSFEQSGGSGTWDNNFLGLVGSAKISDESKLWAQLQATTTETVRFTWMFVDFQVSENLSAHVGRVKFPWGIYNEYIDTRALQFSVGKPLAYATEADLAYDAYDGAGIDYNLDMGSKGKLTLQGFYGNIFSAPDPLYTPPYPDQYQMGNLEAITNDKHVIGGKITWETPIDGLRLLVSANRTKLVTTADSGQIPDQQGEEDRYILSVDYVNDWLDLKSEYNSHKYPGLTGYQDEKSRAWYVQAGFPLGKWTPYTRYDSVVTDKNQSSDPSFFQRTVVIGINRKLSTNLNFRIEENFNHGYALPVAAGETLAGTGKVNWQLLAAQINFMF
jgi:hypothetical protein